MARSRSYAGQSLAQRRTDRREKLVRAAITLLADHGASATTMTRICAEAGLTERYFYESFPRREDALLAALDHATHTIVTAAVAATQGAPGEPGARIRSGMQALVDVAAADPAAVRVAIVESSRSAELRERRHGLLTALGDTAAEEAAGLFGEDAWPPGRARLQATVLVAGYAELVGFWLRGESDVDDSALVEVGTDLFTTLMRRPGNSEK